MPFRYKIDILVALKEAGYNTGRIRREKIMGERTLQYFRENRMVSLETIEVVCNLLDCDFTDLIELVKNEETEG